MRTARLIALALAASCGGSQTATRPEPEPVAPAPATQAAPADPQPTVDGDVTEARVGGMQILVKNVPGAEIVAMQLHVRGGVRNWGKADAGVEALLMRTAASGGAGSLDKSAFARKLGVIPGVMAAEASDADNSSAQIADFGLRSSRFRHFSDLNRQNNSVILYILRELIPDDKEQFRIPHSAFRIRLAPLRGGHNICLSLGLVVRARRAGRAALCAGRA